MDALLWLLFEEILDRFQIRKFDSGVYAIGVGSRAGAAYFLYEWPISTDTQCGTCSL